MPRRFSLAADVFDTPSVDSLRDAWRNIPDVQARNVIAVEAQYLAFHKFLLDTLRHAPTEGGDRIPIGLSVRAGALKAATLVCASIAEAALRAHAEARGYPLHANPRRRTFGALLGAWQSPQGTARPDVAGIWDQLDRLHNQRNTVHLYPAVNGDFYDILAAERRSLAEGEQVLEHLRQLVSV